MNKWAILLAISGAACAWSQMLDLSSLDKLAAKATEKNVVNLTADQLRAAMQFMADDKKEKSDEFKKLLGALEAVSVRNYEFDKPGMVQDSDLAPIRAQLARMKGWGKIVDSQEKHEHSEVYMLMQDGKAGGFAIIDVEPKELSVVQVKGAINPADLRELHGVMGLPSIRIGPQPRPPVPPPAPSVQPAPPDPDKEQ
jgi:Domain of unknown function (DUF4252)